MAAPSLKEQYEAAIKALGGKGKATRERPWEFAALKREFAAKYSGAAAQNMLASASVLEDTARQNGVPRPAAAGGGGGGGGGGAGGGGGGGGR